MPQRVQKSINIKIAKTHRTLSFETSCMMARVPPTGLAIEEKATLNKTKHDSEQSEFECDLLLLVRERPHPVRRLNIMAVMGSTPHCTEIHNDGSNTGGKVAAGAAICVDQVLKRQCKYKLQNCCSNSQAEQLAILKSLEKLTSLPKQIGRTAAVYTDSKMTLASLRSNPIHSRLIEEIRNKV
jgi:hypothetical protein